MNQHIKDVAVKMLVTFLEGFGASWSLTSFALTKVALIGAVAAGLSAVYNITKKVFQTSTNLPV